MTLKGKKTNKERQWRNQPLINPRERFRKMFSNLSYTYHLNKGSVSRKSRNYPRIVYIWVNQSKFVYIIITVYNNIIVQNFVEQLMRKINNLLTDYGRSFPVKKNRATKFEAQPKKCFIQI